MGKSLIIKGADFSVNGIPETPSSLDITALVGASGCWYPQSRIGGLNPSGTYSDTKRCCIFRFLLSTVPGIENYQKIRVSIKSGFDYVLDIGVDGGGDAAFVRVTGIDTYDTSFNWVTDNQVAEIAIGNRNRIDMNIRFDDNTTTFPSDADISDYMVIELLNP